MGTEASVAAVQPQLNSTLSVTNCRLDLTRQDHLHTSPSRKRSQSSIHITMSTTGTIQNRAAWLSEPNTALRVGDAELPNPEFNEVLIKVHAVAINPVEAGRQAMGLFNVSYPWIFGCDLAGIVEGVGADVTRFKVGELPCLTRFCLSIHLDRTRFNSTNSTAWLTKSFCDQVTASQRSRVNSAPTKPQTPPTKIT